MTDEELDFMIVQLKKVLRPDMLLVAYWEDQLVGYCVNVPDINSALRWSWGRMDWIRLPQFLFWLPRVKRTRVIALADEAFRRKGVGILLSTEMKTRGLRSAYRQWEFSWIDWKTRRRFATPTGSQKSRCTRPTGCTKNRLSTVSPDDSR